MGSCVLYIADHYLAQPPEGVNVVLVDVDPSEAVDSGDLTLHEYYVQHSEGMDFFSAARELFARWAERNRFLEQAVSGDYSLLCPLRWSIFQQIKYYVQKVEMLDFAISHLGPGRVVVDSTGKLLPRLVEQICQAKGIECMKTGPTGERGSLVCRLFRGQVTWPELKRSVILKWHNVFTHSITPKVAAFVAQKVGAMKARLCMRLHGPPKTLFFSTVSNWQKPFGEGTKWRELILGGFIEHCSARGEKTMTLTMTDDPDKVFRSVFTYPLSTLYWDSDVFDIGSSVAKDAEHIRNWAQSPETRELLQYKGVDFSSFLLGGVVEPAIRFVAREREKLMRSRKWLEYLSPERIVMVGELSVGVPLIIAAHEARIPVVGVSHAVIFPNSTIYSYAPNEMVSLVPQCTKFCVWAKYEKELVTGKNGFYVPDDVLVIGSPKQLPSNTAGVRKALGINSNLPIALCTSNNRHHNFAQGFMKEWAVCKDEYYLVVKMHPREVNYGQFRRWAKHYGIENIKIIKDFDTLALLSECVVHLSFSTTVIIEAAWLGIPTILFDGGLKNDPLEAAEMGVAFYLSDYGGVTDAIHSVLSSDGKSAFEIARKSFIAKRFTPEVDIAHVFDSVSTSARKSQEGGR